MIKGFIFSIFCKLFKKVSLNTFSVKLSYQFDFESLFGGD